MLVSAGVGARAEGMLISLELVHELGRRYVGLQWREQEGCRSTLELSYEILWQSAP